MPTNDERHEVARKLRQWHCKGWRIDVLPSKVCHDLWCELEKLLKTEDSNRYEDTFVRLADLIEPEPELICKWREDENGLYHTSCGEIYETTADTREENGIMFCPYCGREVVSND